MGTICDYDNSDTNMPSKILEMGLLPGTKFQLLYQAPFNGPLYVEYGDDKSRVALRPEEAAYVLVEHCN